MFSLVTKTFHTLTHSCKSD